MINMVIATSSKLHVQNIYHLIAERQAVFPFKSLLGMKEFQHFIISD